MSIVISQLCHELFDFSGFLDFADFPLDNSVQVKLHKFDISFGEFLTKAKIEPKGFESTAKGYNIDNRGIYFNDRVTFARVEELLHQGSDQIYSGPVPSMHNDVSVAFESRKFLGKWVCNVSFSDCWTES